MRTPIKNRIEKTEIEFRADKWTQEHVDAQAKDFLNYLRQHEIATARDLNVTITVDIAVMRRILELHANAVVQRVNSTTYP